MARKVDAKILRELESIVGQENLLLDAERLEPYSHDETVDLRADPDVVVRATSAQQVSAIFKLANRERLPVTPRGAGYGLSGGAVAVLGGIILSLEKMVLDNHLAHQIETMVKPAPVDEAHLQVDLIERVGIGGHYLKQRETRTFTRQEYVPRWPPAGKTMREIARAEALEILNSHKPPTLPAGAAEKIEAIVTEADRALA